MVFASLKYALQLSPLSFHSAKGTDSQYLVFSPDLKFLHCLCASCGFCFNTDLSIIPVSVSAMLYIKKYPYYFYFHLATEKMQCSCGYIPLLRVLSFGDIQTFEIQVK